MTKDEVVERLEKLAADKRLMIQAIGGEEGMIPASDITNLFAAEIQLTEEAVKLLGRLGGGCDVCAGRLVFIRGKHPGDYDREVCPTCLKESVEDFISRVTPQQPMAVRVDANDE